MSLDDFIALVATYTAEYDRPAVCRFYNVYRKSTSDNEMPVHEYVERNLPQKGDTQILTILTAYGPASYSEIASAVKWLRQNKQPVRETLCGPCTPTESAKKLQIFLDNATPAQSEFECFCHGIAVNPALALYTDFRRHFGNQMVTNQVHPFVADHDFWMGSLAELHELFKQWYLTYSANFPSEVNGYLSVGECATFLGITTRKLLTWLQMHPDSFSIHNSRYLIATSTAKQLHHQWSAVCPIKELLIPKLAQIPYQYRQTAKITILNMLHDSKPPWALEENTFPQQVSNVYYTDHQLVADHALTELIHALPMFSIGLLKDVTGMTHAALCKKAELGAIEATKDKNGNWIVSINERNRVQAINHQYRTVDDIVQSCLHQYPSKFCLTSRYNRDNLISFCESNDWWELDILDCKELPLDGKKLGYAVNCDDTDQLAAHLSLWIQGYQQKPFEKFKLLVARMAARDSDTAMKLQKFERDFHPADNALVDMVQLLCIALPAALQTLTDSDIEHILVARFSAEATLTACNTLSDFLLFGNYTKRRFEFLGSGIKIDTSAYSVKSFAIMVWHIVNDEVIQKRDLVNKAIGTKKYADLWLFIALHIYASWRSTDYIRMSAPQLPYSPEEILEKIKSGLLLPSEATAVAEYFIASNSLVLNKPNKTAGTSGVPDLYFYCPQSCLESFGIILSIATAHYQLAEADSFVVPVKDWLSIKEFFGDDFLEACGNRSFSGRRANKALLQSIECVGREDHQLPPMVAYHLASVMRSHKLSYGKPSEITDIYLRDAKFSGLTPEFVIYQMWERGVCSFVTDAMMKICYGDKYKSLPISLQTQALNSIGLTPSEVTNLLQCIHDAQDHALEVVFSICQSKQTMEDVMKSIALGHGTGKAPNVFCLCKAAGKACAETSRQNCMGCRYEIRTKSLLSKYAAVHYQLCHVSPDMSPTERAKRRYLAQACTFPAIAEILLHLDTSTNQMEYQLYKEIIEEEVMAYGIADGRSS